MNNEKDINIKLKELGTNLKGMALYRVSFSDKQTEVRKRTYNNFSPSGKIFLGVVSETVECKKYPTIKAKWILEKWCPPSPDYTNEIVSAKENGSYECIYVFQDIEGYYLPLDVRVALIVAQENLTPGRLGRLTDDSVTAQEKEDRTEEGIVTEDVMSMYEDLMKVNKNYADGANANKSGDYFINDSTQTAKSKTLFDAFKS